MNLSNQLSPMKLLNPRYQKRSHLRPLKSKKPLGLSKNIPGQFLNQLSKNLKLTELQDLLRKLPYLSQSLFTKNRSCLNLKNPINPNLLRMLSCLSQSLFMKNRSCLKLKNPINPSPFQTNKLVPSNVKHNQSSNHI